MSCIFPPLCGPVPALRLRPRVGLAVDEPGLLRLEGGGARDVVCVEGEHVDPVAVALQRPAQRTVRRPPHLDRAILSEREFIIEINMKSAMSYSSNNRPSCPSHRGLIFPSVREADTLVYDYESTFSRACVSLSQ